ncbi:MAG: hypothetical protein K9W46_13940 [Candidatus Heimdallarchaeum endolithica]|uniref:MalT-like TPR region domain-containing protein n=1 Tax=Candidatus Heimdallarchaeum endolithica TaxID=2876572 RepID=A0A9Y1BR70_9ARCH|nr:MAG: hypothetical protein K9W46_13940 [Candidatus Heimdallarchaeum endolithica]
MNIFPKYHRLFSSDDAILLPGFSEICSIYDFYETLIDNWDKIIRKPLTSPHLSTISYILMSYSDYERLKELFDLFSSLEVASNYIKLLANQGKKEEVEKILSTYKPIKEPIECWFDLIGWGIYYFSQTQQKNKLNEFLDEFEEGFQKISKLMEKTDLSLIHLQAFKLYIEGSSLYYRREYFKSVKLAKKAVDLLIENDIEDNFLLGSIYNLLAINYSLSGSGPEKEMLYKVRDTFNEERMDRGVAIAKGNLAYLLIREGKFEEAMTLLLEFDEIMRKYSEIRNLILNYSDIYYCLKSLGKMDEAERNLEIAMQLMEEYNSPNEDIYIDATEFYALKGEIEKAEFFLNKYSQFLDVEEKAETVKNATTLIYQGFIDFKKKNFYDADLKLKKGLSIARKQNVIPLVLQALIYLIELNISKYKIEASSLVKEEIIEEIEILSQETIAILKFHDNIFQMINYQQLLATAYILSNKVSLAISLLEEAEKISIKHNMMGQIKQIKELMGLAKSVDNYVNGAKVQIHRELEKDLQTYSSKAIREITILRDQEEEPTLLSLLVIQESGLPCFSYNFKDESFTTDELLLSGLINAIQKFSSEISWKKGKFRLMAHSDYILLIEPHEKFSIALFVDGYDTSFREKMSEFAEYVKPLVDKLGDQKYLDGETCIDLDFNLKGIVEKIFIPEN